MNLLGQLLQSKIFGLMSNFDKGQLTFTDLKGRSWVFNEGDDAVVADLSVKDIRFFFLVVFRGEVGFFEAYREGYFETSRLDNLLYLMVLNFSAIEQLSRGMFLFKGLSRLVYYLRKNTKNRSKKNIAFHYDLGNEFYSLWLDSTMTYSSALFQGKDVSLKEAQLQKYDRIIEQVSVPSGTLLEIGCGWGGFAQRLLDTTDMTMKGITLSKEQLNWVHQHVQNERVDFRLEDYRIQNQKYDAIVSIEMIEAVGEEYLSVYFQTIKDCLKVGGKAVVQMIVVPDELFDIYRKSVDMIRSYVFPGSFLTCMKQVKQKVGECGLKLADAYEFSYDYALTLQKWRENFDSIVDQLDPIHYDSRFVQTWRYYLDGCRAAFLGKQTFLFQVTLEHLVS